MQAFKYVSSEYEALISEYVSYSLKMGILKNTTAMLGEQLKIINEEGLSSLQDVRNKMADTENEIRKTQEQLNALSKHFVNNYDEITTLKNTLAALKKKVGVYKSIIEACSNEDYISRLVRLSREKMTEQENAKLQAMHQEKYIIYCPQSVEQLPYMELSNKYRNRKIYKKPWWFARSN